MHHDHWPGFMPALLCCALAMAPVTSFSSDGCGGSPAVAPGQVTNITVNSSVRSASAALFLPSAYDANHETALLVGLHGWTGTGNGALKGSGTDKSANVHGYITVWPDGENYPLAKRGWAFPGCNASPLANAASDQFGRRPVCADGNAYDCDVTTCPNDGPGFSAVDYCTLSGLDFPGAQAGDACMVSQLTCNMGSGQNCNWCGCVDDEQFLRDLVAQIAADYCVDLQRVYLTGMSQGGMMTSFMSSRMTDVFAAFTAQAGTNPRDFYGKTDNTSVMWLHGYNDNVVPHDGAVSNDGYYYEDVLAEIDRASSNTYGSCNSTTAWPIPGDVAAPGSANLQCTQCSEAASQDYEFVACTWNGGHVWPKARGKKASSLWGNRLMWDFMSSHCLDADNRCDNTYVPPSGGGGGGGGGGGKPKCHPKRGCD